MPPRRKNSLDPKRALPGRAIAAKDRPKHLIVDGYNLIHSHPELKKMLRFGTDAVRDELAKQIRVLHDFDGWRMTIIFDGRGGTLSIEQPYKDSSFAFVYSPSGISADEIIEQMVKNTSERDDVVVATSDGGIRIFIQGNGARWLPPEELWRWVKDANESVTRFINIKKS